MNLSKKELTVIEILIYNELDALEKLKDQSRLKPHYNELGEIHSKILAEMHKGTQNE